MSEMSKQGEQLVVSHEILTQALEAVDSDTSASEAHGVISGVLCVSSDEKASSKWVPLLLSDAAQMDAEAAKKLSLLLLYLHQNTHTAFKANNFTFEPLMPDDEKPVATRIEALGEWCRGYLLGLSVHGPEGKQELSEQRKEFVEDLIEISNVQLDQEGENEAEGYLLELYEFVRVGVQTVFDDNQPIPQPKTDSQSKQEKK